MSHVVGKLEGQLFIRVADGTELPLGEVNIPIKLEVKVHNNEG